MGSNMLEDFKAIHLGLMKKKDAEREISQHLAYMDLHLKLLSIAKEKNNQEVIELQLAQLEKIRRYLIELEYFPFPEKTCD